MNKGCDYQTEIQKIFETISQKLGYDRVFDVKHTDGRLSGTLELKLQLEVQRGKKKGIPQYVIENVTYWTSVCVWFHYLTKIDACEGIENVEYFDQSFVVEVGGHADWFSVQKATREAREQMRSPFHLHLARGYSHTNCFKHEGIQRAKLDPRDFAIY